MTLCTCQRDEGSSYDRLPRHLRLDLVNVSMLTPLPVRTAATRRSKTGLGARIWKSTTAGRVTSLYSSLGIMAGSTSSLPLKTPQLSHCCPVYKLLLTSRSLTRRSQTPSPTGPWLSCACRRRSISAWRCARIKEGLARRPSAMVSQTSEKLAVVRPTSLLLMPAGAPLLTTRAHIPKQV